MFFLTVAANVLDAFAFVTEKEVGEAFGSGHANRVRRSIRITAELALMFGVVVSVVFYFAGAAIISSFVQDIEARDAAIAFLPYCASVPVIGIAAWQLDGVFIGATQGRALRNAGVLSAVLYVGTDIWMSGAFGNTGVWIAFLSMYAYRAICLGSYWPNLMRQLRRTEAAIG